MGNYAASAALIFSVFLAGAALAGEPVADARQTLQTPTAAPQSLPASARATAENPVPPSVDKAAKQCGHPKPVMQPHAATSEDEYQGSPDWEVGEELC